MISNELIEGEASRWLAARDADGPAASEAELNSWLEADIRHRVAYLRVEAHWRRSERLRDLRPLDRDVDPDLLRPHNVWRHWPLAAAASVLLLLSAAIENTA